MKIKVRVEFVVNAEPLGPWSAEDAARDYIRHVIDEGYKFDEVESWDFVDFVPCERIVE